MTTGGNHFLLLDLIIHTKRKKTMVKILFICHGNICRSVSAQYIFQDLVNRRGLAGQFVIDSAATSTEEIGNAIYPPMRAALERRDVTDCWRRHWHEDRGYRNEVTEEWNGTEYYERCLFSLTEIGASDGD